MASSWGLACTTGLLTSPGLPRRQGWETQSLDTEGGAEKVGSTGWAVRLETSLGHSIMD